LTIQREPDNWRKSSWSSSNPDCVEVANNDVVALVRDTKNRDGGQLAVPTAAWSAFTDAVRAGRA
jgi:Domain of unknown function (DUF397)